MSTSPWTPIDETASAWKPVEESVSAPPSRESTPEYQAWKKKRAEFEAMPLAKRLWVMMKNPSSVPDPDGPGPHFSSASEGPELIHNLAGYVDTSAGDVMRGSKDIAHGDIAKGGHEVISGTMTGLTPIAPFLVAGAPITAARTMAGGYLTGKVAETATKAAGGNEDQQAFANDLGNVGGGFVAGSGLPRALLETPIKELAAKHGVKTLLDVLEAEHPTTLIRKTIAGKMRSALENTGTTEGTASGPVPADSMPTPAAPTPQVAPVPENAGPSTIPRTNSGEGVLNQALTSLDNKTLLKVAKSRGIDVTREAQLKPGKADASIINKIMDSFTQDELDNARDLGLEASRHKPLPTDAVDPEAAKEAWHFKVLSTFFPDVAIPKAMQTRVANTLATQMQARFQAARAAAESKANAVPMDEQPQLATEENTLELLKKSFERARAAKMKAGRN